MTETSQFVFRYADIRESGGLNVKLAPPPAAFADAFDSPETLKKLRLELDFSVGGESILLEGKVYAELELVCSRCADPLARAFEDSFDEVYPDSLEYIDTREVIRETVALLAPMKVLCSEACKGRCLVCGANRNSKVCGCRPDMGSQFGALKDLKLIKPDKPGRKDSK
ncbi:MAG: DUF177 domain-containing protein [Elusimicrobia bacterium]|nr:DUF177 domain-containing protein [Elusimicrobiota bacterium]